MTRFLLLAVLCALLPFSARAQEASSFTILDFGPLNLDLEKANPKPADVLSKIGNKEMRSVLELQNQITMLNALSNWQDQVVKLKEVYEKTGMAFEQPKPPYDICEQVPPNSICGDAYPEMAPEEDVAPAPVSTKIASVAKPKKKNAAPEKAPANYEWQSVQCVSNDCKAVLKDLSTGARFTVLQGELISDSVMVRSVTADGVTLTVRGEAQKLKPSAGGSAPVVASTPGNLQDALKGIPSSPDPAPSSEAIVLDDGTQSDSAAPVLNADNAPTGSSTPIPEPNASNDTGEAGLGPTGLF